MTWSKFNPGCPCCGCDYFFDDFNRENSTTVGANYTEVSGDWSVTSTALLIQALNAIITIDVANPDAEPNGAVSFAFFAFHDGDQPRFIFDYQDTDNYKFVQITVGDPNGCLAIYSRASGTNTLLASRRVAVPNNAFGSCYVYWGPHPDGHNYIAAIMPDDSFNVEEAYVEVRGITFTNDAKGFGSGSLTSAIFFDQATIWKHWSESSSSCPYVTPLCSLVDDDWEDMSTLGCSWEVDSGTWSVGIGVASTSSASAAIETLNPHPESDGTMSLTVQLRFSEVGGSVRLAVGSAYLDLTQTEDDGANYVSCVSSGGGTPQEFLRDPGETITATVCYDGEDVYYTAFGASASIAGDKRSQAMAGGQTAKITNTGSGTLTLLSASVRRVGDQCPGCTTLGTCHGITFPSALRVEWPTTALADGTCDVCASETTGSVGLSKVTNCQYRRFATCESVCVKYDPDASHFENSGISHELNIEPAWIEYIVRIATGAAQVIVDPSDCNTIVLTYRGDISNEFPVTLNLISAVVDGMPNQAPWNDDRFHCTADDIPGTVILWEA